MARFVKDFLFNSAVHSASFRKGDEAPVDYPVIIEAAYAAGALAKRGKDGLVNFNAENSARQIESQRGANPDRPIPSDTPANIAS